MGPQASKSYPGRRLVKPAGPQAERAKQEIDYGRRDVAGYVFGAFQPASGAALTATYTGRTTAGQSHFRTGRGGERDRRCPTRLAETCLLHDVECHVSQDGKIPRAVVHTGSVLILIHHDIEPPVQPVFNPPMLASDVVETLCGQRRTEQVVGGLGGGLGRGFADAGYLADGGEAGPLVGFLQPTDIGRDHGRAGFDAAVISINGLNSWRCVVHRIIEVEADVIMQRALVALQRQEVIAALVY